MFMPASELFNPTRRFELSFSVCHAFAFTRRILRFCTNTRTAESRVDGLRFVWNIIELIAITFTAKNFKEDLQDLVKVHTVYFQSHKNLIQFLE